MILEIKAIDQAELHESRYGHIKLFTLSSLHFN